MYIQETQQTANCSCSYFSWQELPSTQQNRRSRHDRQLKKKANATLPIVQCSRLALERALRQVLSFLLIFTTLLLLDRFVLYIIDNVAGEVEIFFVLVKKKHVLSIVCCCSTLYLVITLWSSHSFHILIASILFFSVVIVIFVGRGNLLCSLFCIRIPSFTDFIPK